MEGTPGGRYGSWVSKRSCFFYILRRDPQGFAFLLRWGAQYLWKEASETIGPSKHKSVTPRGCFCAPLGGTVPTEKVLSCGLRSYCEGRTTEVGSHPGTRP